MWEISGLAICGLRKKLAYSTSANLLILDFILTNLDLKYSNSYICIDWLLKSVKFRGIPRSSDRVAKKINSIA